VKNAKKERLNELMADFKGTVYKADYDVTMGPKCHCCDKNRRMQYTTPLGRTADEACKCADRIVKYFPKECVLYSFGLYDDKLGAKYFEDREDGREMRLSSYEQYVAGTDFADLREYWTVFENKEDCQAYCDWLTAKKGA
jgi:hypothetical protein